MLLSHITPFKNSWTKLLKKKMDITENDVLVCRSNTSSVNSAQDNVVSPVISNSQ